MALIQEGKFTSDGNARDLDFGSEVLSIQMYNLTQYNSTANPGVLKRCNWSKSMPAASYFGVKNTNGAATDQSIYAAANGFSAFSEGAIFGAPVSGFTNANPGVITVSKNPADFGIAAGDTLVVGGIREAFDAAKPSLNGEYTVASVTATTITLAENTTGSRVYSSGGVVYDKSQPTENVGSRGISLGSAVVGANNDVWHYKVELVDAD